MHKIFLIFSIFLFQANCFASDLTKIDILKIYDGDTIQAKIGKEKFSIRLIGIDCFETSKINRTFKQAYENNLSVDDVIKKGISSKNYLEELYKNNKDKQVYLNFKGIDKYSRALGVVYFDKLNINDEMKKNGMCLEYKW